MLFSCSKLFHLFKILICTILYIFRDNLIADRDKNLIGIKIWNLLYYFCYWYRFISFDSTRTVSISLQLIYAIYSISFLLLLLIQSDFKHENKLNMHLKLRTLWMEYPIYNVPDINFDFQINLLLSINGQLVMLKIKLPV